MLRRDTNARLVKRGFWAFTSYEFQIGRLRWKSGLNRQLYEELLRLQKESPMVVLEDPERRRTWWMFKGEFYWEDEGFDRREVQALILEMLRKKDRRVRRAITHMEQGEPAQTTAREPIPDDVKVFVWNRDGGTCVKCGSQEKLEYDHIIPFSRGGSNTARNIQLLCETCNRSKSDSLV